MQTTPARHAEVAPELATGWQDATAGSTSAAPRTGQSPPRSPGRLRSNWTPAQHTLLSLVGPCGQARVFPGTDWTELDALVERLWLAPRLAARCEVLSPAGVPADLQRRWADARRVTAARNLLLAGEEARLLEALSKAGVEAIPLKGVSLARILYGDISVRPSEDVDLGIRPAQVARAAALLRDMGYQLSLPLRLLERKSFLASTDEFTSEVQCLREYPGARLAVELHWRWLPLPEETVWSSLAWYNAAQVRTLSREIYFLFLCAHLAGGGWAGLRWWCDIADFLVRLLPATDVRSLTLLVQQAGLKRMVGITLSLVATCFGVRSVALGHLQDGQAMRAAADYAHRGFEPERMAAPVPVHRERVALRDSMTERAGYLWRLMYPTHVEWTTPQGTLRSAPAAWMMRAARLIALCAGALMPHAARATRPEMRP